MHQYKYPIEKSPWVHATTERNKPRKIAYCKRQIAICKRWFSGIALDQSLKIWNDRIEWIKAGKL